MTEKLRTHQKTPERKILINKIKCTHCGEILESKFRHDFKVCACGTVMIDGGLDYLKRGFTIPSDYMEMSEYE